MKQKNRVHLLVEPLEDRWVPATVRLTSSGLFISNPLITNGKGGLFIKATADNTFSVYDTHGGTTSPGAFHGMYTVAGNIYITGSNAPDNIKVDMNGFGSAGNLFVNSGNGNDTVSVASSLTSSGSSGYTVPTIGGNVTTVTGYGDDSVGIASTGVGFRVSGSIQDTSSTGNDSFVFGNATGVSTVGGNVTVTGASGVTIGQGKADVISGDLNVNSTLNTTGLKVTLGSGSTGISVLGNTTVTGGTGADAVTVNGAGTFGGNVNLNLGEGANTFSAGTSGAGITVDGNLNYVGGNGVNTIGTLLGTFQGNFAVNLGDGDNLLNGLNGGYQIAGNLTVSAGNGNNSLSIANGASCVIDGDISANFGNGNNNTFILLASGIPGINCNLGGDLSLRAGNGNNSVSLASEPTGYKLPIDLVFGNGNNTLNLFGGGALGPPTSDGGFTGRVAGGTGTNTLNIFGSPPLVSPFELSGF